MGLREEPKKRVSSRITCVRCPLGAKGLAVVDALALMAHIRQRHVPELQEEPPGLVAAGELGPGIILSIVMIIPGGEMRDGAPEPHHPWHSGRLGIRLLKALDQLPIRPDMTMPHVLS